MQFRLGTMQRVIKRGGGYYPQYKEWGIMWNYFCGLYGHLHYSTLEEAKKYLKRARLRKIIRKRYNKTRIFGV